MSSTSSKEAAAATHPPLGVIFSATIGSALEWYDFFLYGTAAALVFGPLFFPKFDPLVGTLLSFATFGVGFIVHATVKTLAGRPREVGGAVWLIAAASAARFLML